MAPVVIRTASAADAPRVLQLQRTLDRESRFMLLEPDERAAEPAELRERLARQAGGADPSVTLIADDGGPIGYVDVSVPPYRRARGTGYLVMGVLAAYGGRGTGRALLRAAVDAARDRGMRRLELTVMTHNHRALRLYLAGGFLVEGLRRAPLEIDGRPVDEYYMGLLL